MNRNKLINKILPIITSAQTFLMAALFIVQVLRIYYGNKKVFTREICSLYLMQILPVIIIWIIILIVSFVYYRLNEQKDKNVSKITNMVKLENLERICPDFDDVSLKDDYELLNKQKKNRKIASIINIVIIIICSVMGLCYLLNSKHFDASGNLNEQAIQMGIHLLPWVIISFISLIGCTIYQEYSAKTSINLIKGIIVTNGKKSSNSNLIKKQKKTVLITQIAIITVAIAFIIHGIIDDQALDVLYKAIKICTECIGLG